MFLYKHCEILRFMPFLLESYWLFLMLGVIPSYKNFSYFATWSAVITEIWKELSQGNKRNFRFSGFPSFLLKYKTNISFFKLYAREFHFRNIINFSRAGFFFTFPAWKVTSWNFLFWGLESSVSWNIRKTFFRKNKKVPFPEI